MVKVLDPDGDIIGVYETAADVPEKVPNRWGNYHYPREDLEVVEVSDEKDRLRLLPTMQQCMGELRGRE